MDKKLIHHNHNSKVAQVLVGSGIKANIVIPGPGSVFANIYCSGVRKDAKVAKFINIYHDWTCSGTAVAGEEVMDLFEFAVAMTPYVSEVKYWEDYDPLSSAMKASEL